MIRALAETVPALTRKTALALCAGTLCCLASGCMFFPKPCEADAMAACGKIESESLKNEKLSVADVSGGQETHWWWMSNVGNPELRRALEISLMNAGAFSQETGRYALSAEILCENAPFVGTDLTCEIDIHYSVYDTLSGSIDFEKRISSEGRTRFFEEILGVHRLRICKERAVRANIEKFFEELNEAHP